MLYTAPHYVSIDAGHDGKSALNTSLFTFMIDSGIQAALVLLAIFAELEPTLGEPPPLDPHVLLYIYEKVVTSLRFFSEDLALSTSEPRLRSTGLVCSEGK